MRGKGQVSELDCRTAESMVNRYIDHTLNVDELEEFLDHVESCPSCYDELETYFIVHEVTQQLDEQENGIVLDFKDLLTQDIRRARRYIHKKGDEIRNGTSDDRFYRISCRLFYFHHIPAGNKSLTAAAEGGRKFE